MNRRELNFKIYFERFWMNSLGNNFSKHRALLKKFTGKTKVHLAEILTEYEWDSLVNW